MTKKELKTMRRPHYWKGNWFYISDQTIDIAFPIKSLEVGTKMVYFPMSKLLRALDDAGILRRWDSKQRVLMKDTE